MGYILVSTGTDGCGKQTQAEKLFNRLKAEGYNIRKQSLPNYDSPGCAPVKMYLSGEFGDSDMSLDAYQASSLFSIDRLCTYNKDLKDFYENDGIILFDRYVESNMLHQAGKISDHDERDIFLDWLENFEFEILKLPRANKTIFLDVPVEVSLALARAREGLKNQSEKDIHENNNEHMYKAYASGKYVCDKYNWNVIDCVKNGSLRTIDDIAEEIYNLVISDISCFKGE